MMRHEFLLDPLAAGVEHALARYLCRDTLADIPTERFHVMSLPSRLRRKTENSRHVGVQRDRNFYSDLHKMSDILIMLLICVESDKIPLLHKLKQLYI